MRTQRQRYVHIRFVIALAGDAKTNGTTAAAKVSAAIPVRAFNGLSVMIFLRRLWKIPALTTSLPRSRRLRNPISSDGASAIAKTRRSFDVYVVLGDPLGTRDQNLAEEPLHRFAAGN